MSIQGAVNQLINIGMALYSQSDAYAAKKEGLAKQRAINASDAQYENELQAITEEGKRFIGTPVEDITTAEAKKLEVEANNRNLQRRAQLGDEYALRHAALMRIGTAYNNALDAIKPQQLTMDFTPIQEVVDEEAVPGQLSIYDKPQEQQKPVKPVAMPANPNFTIDSWAGRLRQPLLDKQANRTWNERTSNWLKNYLSKPQTTAEQATSMATASAAAAQMERRAQTQVFNFNPPDEPKKPLVYFGPEPTEEELEDYKMSNIGGMPNTDDLATPITTEEEKKKPLQRFRF